MTEWIIASPRNCGSEIQNGTASQSAHGVLTQAARRIGRSGLCSSRMRRVNKAGAKPEIAKAQRTEGASSSLLLGSAGGSKSRAAHFRAPACSAQNAKIETLSSFSVRKPRSVINSTAKCAARRVRWEHLFSRSDVLLNVGGLFGKLRSHQSR